jgi:hypothetical protein
MTGLFARMAASFLRLATRLLTAIHRIFAILSFMTGLRASVKATFQLLSAGQTTRSVTEPTGLVLYRLLPTFAALGYQVWTPGARLIVRMAVMSNLGMATACRSVTWEGACRRPRSAG